MEQIANESRQQFARELAEFKSASRKTTSDERDDDRRDDRRDRRDNRRDKEGSAQRERGARAGVGCGRSCRAVVPGACKAEGAGFGRTGLDGGFH